MNSIWPRKQNNLTTFEIEKLRSQLIVSFENCLDQLAISDELTPYLDQFYIPFAAWLSQKRSTISDTLVVGINGAQGSGKSTMSHLVTEVLQQGFKLKTVVLSIDDLYKTREQREQMANDIHPLFKTRGVPGTHDTALGINLIKKIKALKMGESLSYPVFDKSNDDRIQKMAWPSCQGPIDILIFEGWCVGAEAQTEEALKQNINSLEELEDTKGIWRHAVNEHLKTDYKALYNLLDCLVFLQIPSFNCVLPWRDLQERKRENKQRHVHEQRLMTTEAPLKRFIAHYERLTRFQIEELPGKADLVIKLGEDHQIKKTLFRHT